MIQPQKLNKRQRDVYEQVQELYENSQRKEARWMWKNHVQIVAENCLELAQKYNANADFTFAGGLLHDLGDVWFERDDPRFEPHAKHKTEDILKKAAFTSDEIVEILVKIILPHSCRIGDEQTMIEGKILATADALAHIQTDFYYDFISMGWPQKMKPEDRRDYIHSKIERDFTNKIFFPELQANVKPRYEQLKKAFQNKKIL